MRVATLALLALAFLADASRAETLRFRVLRNGAEIGTHIIDIRRDGGDVRVDIATDIAVKLAFVTVYRFTHEGHETWRDGHLVSLETRTNDDGTRHALAVRLAATDFAVTADGLSRQISQMPLGSLWRADYPAHGAMLNTLDGSIMGVETRVVGEETVETPAGPTRARHVQIRGDLVRDVWLGPDEALVRLTLAGRDGSPVEYRRF